jgi:periplasmic glucans biosynthesis protein
MKALRALAAATLLPVGRCLTAAAQAPDAAKDIPFSAGDVQKQVRALAAGKCVRPRIDLPKQLQDLNFDQYRDIRFKRERALWASERVPFRLELLHRGFLFKEPVAIYVVADRTPSTLSGLLCHV